MDNIKFNKILDFDFQKPKRYHTSFYLEELTDLLTRMAAEIANGNNYCFEKDYYVEFTKENDENYENNKKVNYKYFVEAFKNSFYNGSSKQINIIRGPAGIGKTKFLDKGFQKVIYDKNDNTQRRKYIKLCVDFKNIDERKDVCFYTDMIYNWLMEEAQYAIYKLGENYWNQFYYKYQNYEKCNNFMKKMYPIMFFCKNIYQIYKQPCIIIFDNIDLADFQTQINVYKATVRVCDNIYKNMEFYNLSHQYRVYFAMRPETYVNYAEVDAGKIIDFPLPNILKICLNVIKKTIYEIAEKSDKNDELKCQVEYYSIVSDKRIAAKSFLDVAEYFNKILDHYLNELWDTDPQVTERLGKSEDFHCIVNVI